MGVFMHPCETDMVFRATNEKVPKFNSFVYMQNKQQVGKVDEIFGAINEMARERAFYAAVCICECNLTFYPCLDVHRQARCWHPTNIVESW